MKKIKIITFILFFMLLSIKTYASDRVIYTIKEVSMNNEIDSKVNNTAVANKFKITLKYANDDARKLRITSYNKVDENTIEVYYEENSAFDVRTITVDIDVLNMKLYELNKPNVILKKQDGTVNKLTDLPSDDEISSAIQNLYTRGIINGYEDGTFKPDNTITREEFSSMFARVLGYEIEKGHDSIFTDVLNTRWSKDLIMTLNKKGVISGMGDGTFGATKTITLGELATMVARAENIIPVPNSGIYEHLKTQHWSNQNITNIITSGYLKTSDKMYYSTCQTKEVTRGEVALILNRLRAK